jgi:formylglycine-generating enzyme required for sulfatase activity
MTREKMEKKRGNKQRDHMVVVSDDYSDEDKIGYREHGEGLLEMIRSVKAGGSFTIGVFGQWGQGKTSMLRQIKKDLDTGFDQGRADILTVWFNPWQFSGEEHLIVPFFHTLTAALKKYLDRTENKGQALFDKISIFFEKLAAVPVALAYGLEGGIKIPLLLEAKFKLKETMDEARRREEAIDEKHRLSLIESAEKYESLYYNLIEELTQAAETFALKVVVFIDDLDRCLPEKAVELLEGIKVLLDISGFVFVIGVAREVIEGGVRVRYRELYREQPQNPLFLGQEYLDKIVQFPFTLPPPDTDKLQAMVEGYLENLTEVKPYLSTIHRALGTNPRCLKRFVNNLSYTFWVKDKKMKAQSKEEQFLPELLVKMALIAFQFPRLYQVIGKTPGHLLRIQDFLKDRTEKEKTSKSEGEGVEVEERDQLEDEVKKLNDFIGITELNLFERPRSDSISAILAFEEREINGRKKKDKGFKDEEEVRRYVSLLTVTAGSEKAGAPGINALHETMASRMQNVPGGSVQMDEGSGKKFSAEIRPFLMDKFPVTQDLYRKVTGGNPSGFEGDDRPVETVSWFDAVEFCNLLSDKVGLNQVYTIRGNEVECDWQANGFRLPTEAEWEYACRAGKTAERYDDIDEIAWYKDNSNGSTHSVGQKKPNDFGLYDMLGNVWEWCWDLHGEYSVKSKRDWYGTSKDCFFRGGSWNDNATCCRVICRSNGHPSRRRKGLGFRLVRSF